MEIHKSSTPNQTTAVLTAHIMRVKKRDGSLEPVDVTKIVERVTRCCQGLTAVDPLRVATKAINGLYDGATTKELDNLCIQTASLLIGEDPEYSRLAARLLSTYIEEEVRSLKIDSFADSVQFGLTHGLLADSVYQFVMKHKAELCAAIEPEKKQLGTQFCEIVYF